MAKKPKKNKLKKVRKHFKFELERLARHLGKIADNTSFKDIQEVGLMLGLSYVSYKAFGTVSGTLLGPVSYKLATTPGGAFSPSQLAGVSGLTMLGLLVAGIKGGNPPIGPEWEEGATPDVAPGKELIRPEIDPMTNRTKCPEGYRKVTPWPGIILCQKE